MLPYDFYILVYALIYYIIIIAMLFIFIAPSECFPCNYNKNHYVGCVNISYDFCSFIPYNNYIMYRM